MIRIGPVFFLLAALGAGPAFAEKAASGGVEQEQSSLATTPSGLPCKIGIARVVGTSSSQFEFEGKSYSMSDFIKAMRAANMPTRFDCIVISGGEPSIEQVVKMVRSLQSRTVNHVEWSGAGTHYPKNK